MQKLSNNPRRGVWIIVATVLLIQVALLASSFPLSQVLSGNFAWHIDGPYHVYQLELGRSLLTKGELTGLDPFFGAGYLGGITYNVSARLPALAAGLLPVTISSGLVYSVYVLVCALIAPVAVVGMARVLRWPLIHTTFASLIGVAFWWIGAMRWYHTAGMVSFVCASYLSAMYGAWIWTVCNPKGRGPRVVSIALAGIAGGVGIWLHPLFGILVAPWFLALVIANWKDQNWRSLWVSAGPIAGIALALNLPWILDMLGSPNIANQAPYQKSIGIAVALKPLLGIWSGGSMGSFLNPLSVLLCIVGLPLLGREARRRLIPLFSTAAFLLLFAAFGAANPKIAILQPNRFIAPAFMFFGLGAAFCLGEAALWLRHCGRPALRLVSTAAALLVSVYTGREIYREATPGPHGHYGIATTELTPPPALIVQLESWIQANTSTDGRILFETSLARVHGGGHTAGMLAVATGREFIGAPYPYSLPEVSFWDNAGFGESISKLTSAQLLHGLNYYNVGWIIAHSPRLIALAEHAEFAEPVAQFGSVRIFKIRRPLSFIVSGTANIKARGFNKIEVAGAAGPELTLRYNWLPGLVTTPRAKLEPVQVEAGMPPLIRVIAPPDHFIISTCRNCMSN